MKMTAMDVLMREHNTLPLLEEIIFPCDYNEIKVDISNNIAYVHFDFYNGAMNKYQGARLEAVLRKISSLDDIKVVALMGGERFFSTGRLCD